jgi:hypothetical protein
MATDSAIASLPHALISAYKILSDKLQGKSRPRNVRATCEAICGFVRQLRGVPAWQAELERRTSFIERGCGDGSPWKQAAEKALALLPDALETDDPMEAVQSQIGMSAPYRLRSLLKMFRSRPKLPPALASRPIPVDTGVCVLAQLREVIDGLDVAQNSTGLSEATKSALMEWWRQSVELYDQATAIQADGCRWLNLVYRDLRENPTTPSTALCAVDFAPGLLLGMRDAVESLMHWAAGTATGENRGQAHSKTDKMKALPIDAVEKQVEQFAAATMDENTAKILRIADDTARDADERMKEIIRIDRRFACHTSPKWAALLHVTDARIRQTECWLLRKQLKEQPHLR